jgi:hypothetical protein
VLWIGADEIKKVRVIQLQRAATLKIKGRLNQASDDTVNRCTDQRNEKLETERNGSRVRKPYTLNPAVFLFRLIRLSHYESVDTSVCSLWIRVPRNY